MRKRIIPSVQKGTSHPDEELLDLERLAQVEITSEDVAHPIESALLPGRGTEWRATTPGEQIGVSCLSNNSIKEEPAHFMLHQSFPVLRKHRGIKALFHHIHVQKPSEQKVVIQLLTKLPLTSHRVKSNQEHGLQNSLGTDRGPANLRIHLILSKTVDSRVSSWSAISLILLSGWSFGTRLSGEM